MARRGFSGAVIRAMGASDHTAVVTGSRYLAPHFLRVSFRSETLFDEIEAPPTAWLRFWFPDPDGRPVEHQRGYTISEADEGAGTFSIDVVLHEPAGPASAWARAAEPGDEIALTSLGSSPFEVPEEPPAGYLLIGDSASLPAISAILRTVPDDVPLEVYLEEHTPQDRDIPLPEHPRARVHWVPRRDATSLAAALEARDWSDWYAWVAPETGSLKHLRVRIRDEFGFPKSEQHVQAYWSEGRAMGKRRDHGDAADAAPAPAAGAVAGARGSWRAQAAGRLLRPLRATLVVGGIVQGIVTLIQLAPYVLLAELARLLVTGADTGRLWALGIWAIALLGVGTLLGAALLTWLHVVDGRFERDVRRRLLGKLARLPLGWFDARTSGQVKQLIQDDTLALHYLVTHAVPDAVAAVIAPVAVLAYLFAVDWRIALILFVPVLVYIVTMTIMVTRSGPKVSQSLRWAERMNSEAGGYLDGQPVVRVFGGAAASSFRARLGEYVRFLDEWQRPFSSQKAIMDLATRPSTSLLLIVLLGTLLVVGGAMNPIDLLPSLLLGTTFGSRLMGIGYGLSGVRTGLLAARRVQVTLDERELDVPE